ATVRIVNLPGLAEHADVSNWLDAGGAADVLYQLAERAPLWSPDNAGQPPRFELVPFDQISWTAEGEYLGQGHDSACRADALLWPAEMRQEFLGLRCRDACCSRHGVSRPLRPARRCRLRRGRRRPRLHQAGRRISPALWRRRCAFLFGHGATRPERGSWP